MTRARSIINLACVIRKHESGNVIKVLLVAPLSSLWPRALVVLAARRCSFTDRALVCVAARGPHVSSLCPIRLLNEELWKAGSE